MRILSVFAFAFLLLNCHAFAQEKIGCQCDYCAIKNPPAANPPIDSSPNRVKVDLNIPLKKIGTLKPRSATELSTSRWSLGCEVLDRDYTDYHSYKEYLVPLGIKKIRLQAGWAKTEKKKGEYNWAWLDSIVDDALARGLIPWLQTSYGNPIYEGGGGPNLSDGIPTSEEGLAAWDRWVEAMVLRYKDKVTDWEMWNEPNNLKDNTPEMVAEFNIRTALIIKKIQPEAKIAGLNLGGTNVNYSDKFFKRLAEKDAFGLFETMTYHPYNRNPDESREAVLKFEETLRKYDTRVRPWQGENGCPSSFNITHALSRHYWTELSQAKWFLRRCIGDLSMGHDTNVFAIIDMCYPSEVTTYGLLNSDQSQKVLGIKKSYYAVQNMVSMFEDKMQEVPHAKISAGSTHRRIATYIFKDKGSEARMLALWFYAAIPSDTNDLRPTTIVIDEEKFKDPVYVDLLTGGVYEIPKDYWTTNGERQIFTKIPVYDSPVLIVDRPLVVMQ